LLSYRRGVEEEGRRGGGEERRRGVEEVGRKERGRRGVEEEVGRRRESECCTCAPESIFNTRTTPTFTTQ
jgi:hypothetical protein